MFGKKNITNHLKRALMMGALMTTMGIAGQAGAAPAPAAADYPPVAEVQAALEKEPGTVYPIGGPNVNYERYFTGRTFLAGMASDSIGVANVTFVNGAHTFWHKHHGTCQILVTECGRGYYQIWGEEPQKLTPGTVVTIPKNVKHWHGAAPGAYMQHLSIMQNKEGVSTEWLEPVDEKVFQSLK